MVEATARSGLRATKKQLFSLLESLNEHLRQPHESVQLAAANALREFLFRHFNWSATLTSAETERVGQLTVGKYIKCLLEDGNVAATRGSAMGLGSLNEALLLRAMGVMDDVLAALVRASDRRTLIAGEADAATRCRAVDALIDIAERVRRMTYPTLPLHSMYVTRVDEYRSWSQEMVTLTFPPGERLRRFAGWLRQWMVCSAAARTTA